MPKKPVGILKRNAHLSKSAAGPQKRKKKQANNAVEVHREAAHVASDASVTGSLLPQQQKQPEQFWSCQSEVDRQAAACISKVLASDASSRNGKSIKSLTLAPNIKSKKAVYAVTCQTLQYLPVIQQLLSKTSLLDIQQLRPAVAYVLVYELLFGQGCRIKGKAEKAVFNLKAELQQHLQALLKEAAVEHVDELVSVNIAKDWKRTARVNLLKMTVTEALAWLQSPPAVHQKWARLGQQAQVDQMLSDVLFFPAGSDLHDHPLVTNGSLVLQSKASCLPAHALAPKPTWHVVDACAAPGNKTTHVAALMGGKGTIWAFDRDASRLERLKANAQTVGATSIVAEQADFLSLDLTSQKFTEVCGVILDPSCSGSGTAHSRMDHLLPSQGAVHPDQQLARLQSLAAFQIQKRMVQTGFLLLSSSGSMRDSGGCVCRHLSTKAVTFVIHLG